MKAMVLSNGKFEIKEINNTLEELQKIVGGYIEIPFLSEVFSENEIDMVINEEGKFIDGLNAEIAVVNNNRVVDIIYGNCVFVSHDEEGETIALNDKQIAIVKSELKTKVILTDNNQGSYIEARALFV